MKYLSLSLIALGMAATVGTASAQSLSLSGQPQVNQGIYPAYDNGNTQNAQYDYARVVNVVRVPERRLICVSWPSTQTWPSRWTQSAILVLTCLAK